ncbi:MAG TPA: OmpA family protein [Candidatus Methylomirabilis sp.]|nr:OmpA family protein [Candidatus Methylomirabilis sp.]
MLLLAACAAPKPPPPPAPTPSLFVLLPDPSGAGQITITNPSGTQVLTQSRQASAVPGPTGAPGPPFVLADAQIQQIFGATLAALPPEPAHFILYFKGDSDDLTPESQALLPKFLQTVRDRSPADISIVGHTDTLGDREYNYRLGLRRANRVADLLVVQGVDRSTLDITSHGKNDLLVPTGDQVSEPRNRRVEIIVR